MCLAINRQTLTDCCLVFGITCISVAMCLATSDANNRVTSQHYGLRVRYPLPTLSIVLSSS